MTPDKNQTGVRAEDKEQRKVILISQPEPFIRDTLRIKFASKGYSVITAANARDTIRMAARHKPTVILMEISYKDIEGYRVCQLLKGHETTGSIPIVILTKLADTPERKFMFNAYAKEFMTAPFSPREVVRTVEKAISRT